MNGPSIFQIKVLNKYTREDFDDDLRAILRRFLERMNTLSANAGVPGLLEGDHGMNTQP